VPKLGDGVLLRVLHLAPELFARLLVVGKQVVDDELLWSFTQPLEQRKVPELVSSEDFQHFDRLIANILHKVAHVPWDDPNITWNVVEGARRAFSSEDGDTGAPTEEEGPLIGIRVPVHFAQCTWLNGDMCGRNGLGNGEVFGIGDSDSTTARLEWLLIQHFVGKLVLGPLGSLSAWSLVFNGAWQLRSLKNVLLAGWQMLENFGVEMEVLGNHRFRGMGKPIGEDKGRFLGKSAIIKDEQKFAAIGAQTLEGMWYAAGEIPQIALVCIADEVAPFVVESGDPDAALEDIGPLGFLVPVQFADGALVKSHVDGSQLDTRSQFAYRGLTGPSAFLETW